MPQGVVHIKWGAAADRVLDRSSISIRTMHPERSLRVAELPPPASTLLDKSKMPDLSPFDETLVIDADTVILDRLDHGFARARQFALACCINENPWARRFTCLADAGDVVEYNTGVMFFTRKAAPVFERWKQMCVSQDTALRFFDGTGIKTTPINDQWAFSKAIDEIGLSPLVLPMNWNFRPLRQDSFLGPRKIWHDYADVPADVRRFSDSQRAAGVVIQGLHIT